MNHQMKFSYTSFHMKLFLNSKLFNSIALTVKQLFNIYIQKSHSPFKHNGDLICTAEIANV